MRREPNEALEEKIQRAFAHAVPDVWESVLSDCREQKGSVIPMTEKKNIAKKQSRNHLWAKRFGGIAAAWTGTPVSRSRETGRPRCWR